MALDDTPLPTDVATLEGLLDAVRAHQQATDEDIILANDTGEHLNPARVPRVGIRAEPSGQVWTILESIAQRQIIPMWPFRAPEDKWQQFRTWILGGRP